MGSHSVRDRQASRVVRGSVMHRRHRPRENRFVYPVFFLLIDLNELNSLQSWLFGVNRWRPLAFHFTDHGDGNEPRQWIRQELDRCGITDCNGPVLVQTFPRLFGLVFNPVSFWYCLRPDNSVGAIIAEVNNTFGDRHCYVLQANRSTGDYNAVMADKQMYVSPFYPVSGEYRFHFNVDFSAPLVRIDYLDEGQLQLNTAIWGKARHFSSKTLLLALMRQPFMTLGVIARIHWQALRLWIKRTPLFDRPINKTEEAS
ncbi:MAG: DUF1365 domain-containing protein [Gammaproteobacteria bacterium]|nr:DUF1365 domain-containing protein [Gammaproteobacteria bacterium]